MARGHRARREPSLQGRDGADEASSSAAAPLRRWEELIAEASGLEIEAMHFDQEGALVHAAECYRKVAAKLLEAAESVPDDHAVGRLIQLRTEEVLSRAASLESGEKDGTRLVPPEEHVLAAKLATQGVLASTLASTAGAKPPCAGEDLRSLGIAAAIGGATGLLLIGPLSAASLGLAAAYATTREDAAGRAARKMSATGREVAERAVDSGLKAADLALEEGRKRLLEGIDRSSPNCYPWLHANKDACVRIVAACGALQEALPRKRLSEEARRMRQRYPDRVPVLCSRAPHADLPDIDKNKFVVPGGMLCGEFKYIVHKQVVNNARMDQTIYLFVKGITPKTSQSMSEIYDLHKSDDGFLHFTYCAESTLGRR